MIDVMSGRCVSIHQPAFLPWLGYFERILNSDLHIVLDHVQYEKNSFINRNKIKTPQGSIWLTVPVTTKGKFGSNPICDLKISQHNPWQKKHLKAIMFNYAKAPFFMNYSDFLQDMFSRSWENIADLNLHFIHFALRELKITTPLIRSSEMQPKNAKSELVLELCQKSKATKYLSGVLGKDYLDVKTFLEKGIEVEFQDYKHPQYRQLHGPFDSHLSILDLLLNYGPNSRDILTSASGGEPMRKESKYEN